MLARFLTDPVPAFVMFWLPQYLARERGLVILHMVAFLWVPYAVSDLAYLAGGWLSDRLVRRGFSPSAARRRLMYWGAALMPAAFFVPLVPDTTTAIGAVCVMAIGHSIWSTNLQTMAGDLFPAADVGKSTGFAGGAGAIGGSIANYATGYVVASSGFGPVFFCAGLLHLTAAAWLHRRLR
jgi:ACS family hexuronate transporter-like MFS transporter